VAEALKKKPHQVSDPTRNITINRKERAELETQALAEAFGSWLRFVSCFLNLFSHSLRKDLTVLFFVFYHARAHNSEFTGREVRGSDGLFDDLKDGVVLCLMLIRLGIDVNTPRDPVRNVFESRENLQKFQQACTKAGFNSIPSVDITEKTVLPTLLEAAAVCNAQNIKRDRDEAAGLLVHTRRPSSILPAALTKVKQKSLHSSFIWQAPSL